MLWFVLPFLIGHPSQKPIFLWSFANVEEEGILIGGAFHEFDRS